MIEIEKSDCTDSISFGLNRTGDWRKRMAVKHPFDGRNARAAEWLTKLANEASELTEQDWMRLRPHCGGWANERWREAISQAARAVGFQKKITDLHSFVNHLLDVLSKPSVAA